MDLSKKVRFSITQDNIDLGLPRASWGCAIAMALRDKFPKLEISVVPRGSDHHQVLLYEVQGGIQPQDMLVARYDLSGNASRWVRRFDNDKGVEPATFEMTLVE